MLLVDTIFPHHYLFAFMNFESLYGLSVHPVFIVANALLNFKFRMSLLGPLLYRTLTREHIQLLVIDFVKRDIIGNMLS